MALHLLALRCHWHLCGYGPYNACQFPGHSHDHLVGVFAAGQQASIAFAQPHLRRPTDLLEGLRELFPPELSVATDLGGIAVGPGAFDQNASGMRVPGVGERPLSASLPTGIF